MPKNRSRTDVDDSPIELSTEDKGAELVDPLLLAVEDKTDMEGEMELVGKDELSLTTCNKTS